MKLTQALPLGCLVRFGISDLRSQITDHSLIHLGRIHRQARNFTCYLLSLRNQEKPLNRVTLVQPINGHRPYPSAPRNSPRQPFLNPRIPHTRSSQDGRRRHARCWDLSSTQSKSPGKAVKSSNRGRYWFRWQKEIRSEEGLLFWATSTHEAGSILMIS